MRKRHWWLIHGSFSPKDELEQRPDPLEVLTFFLDKEGITPEKRAWALMKALGIKKDVAYAILRGEWFDSISRCRRLVEVFSIPPQLLALDAHYRGKPCWWKEQGYPFPVGPDDYPRSGEVLSYFRKQMIKEVKGVQQSWTQTDLADALNLSEVTISKMENNHTLAWDRISRRELLARVIQASAKAPQIGLVFALLGLDAQSFSPQQASTGPVIHLPESGLDVTNLETYKQIQRALYDEYFKGHGQDVVEEARTWLKVLTYQVAPLVQGEAQRISLLTTQSLFHQFLGDIAREQRRDDTTLFHLNKAVAFAQDAARFTGKSTALPASTKELEAAALLRRAAAQFEQGTISPAKNDIDRAIWLTEAGPTSHVKSQIRISAGKIYAYAAQSREGADGKQALTYFDEAYQLMPSPLVDDPFYIRSDLGMWSIKRAMALCAPNMRAFRIPNTDEDPFNALDSAEELTAPEMARRRLLIAIFRAQAHIDLKEYEQATNLALDALETSRRLRSRLNRDRIENLYLQLERSDYQGMPLLVRLKVQLQMWKADG